MADCTRDQVFSITIYPKQYFYGNAEQLVCDVRYPWLIPPDQRTPWRQETSIPAPPIGVTTEIWAYQIPDGFYLVVDRLRHFYDPAAFIQGAGAIIWTLDIDAPIGFPLQNWRPVAAFTNSLGTPSSHPFPVGPLQIRGGAVLRYKVLITDPTVPVGPPNTVSAYAGGWLYPVARSGN